MTPVDALLLLIAFALILVGAELFTNGIEWFGRKLELAEGAVGSVLAAVGTALPETMIPLIAILFGGTAEYVALWFKTKGMESGFYVYVTVAIAISLVVYARMRETKHHSRIVED